MTSILGLDCAYTGGTGVAVLSSKSLPRAATVKPLRDAETRPEKLLSLFNQYDYRLVRLVYRPEQDRPIVAIIEEPISPLALKGFGGTGHNNNVMANASAQLACAKWGIPVVTIATTQLKKFATGVGKGGKELVLEAARAHGFGSYRLDIADNNQVDAMWLAWIGAELFSDHFEPKYGWLELTEAAYEMIDEIKSKRAEELQKCVDQFNRLSGQKP